MFCPELVVAYLSKTFGSCEITREPSRKEQKVINSFTYILREAITDSMSIELEEDEVMEDDEEDPVWSGDDDDDNEANSIARGSYRFGDVEVTGETVSKAIAYLRSTQRGSRALKCMQKSFRFLKDHNHMQKLRRIERERDLAADRRIKLRMLAEKLREIVRLKFSAGIALHDSDLRTIALRINETDLHINNFCASRGWIHKFKKSNGIVSRRITTFISKRNFMDSERITQVAQDFVRAVKLEMQHWPLGAVCNADQSGFVKELHSARSLAEKGVKKVERVVQAVSATTHSFTIMPTLFADGHLGDKLFVVLQERQGTFPNRGHFQATNLEVCANVTHMMTKDLLIKWVTTCLAASSSPSNNILLLVDSWTAFRDHSAITAAVPSGRQVKILNIPPGTTSQIQPLDVYFFRPFKEMYKRFISYVHAHDIEFSVHQRDSILKILSLIYSQFCSPRFQNFLCYPWHAAGYLENHPGPFETPVQFCFSLSEVVNCEDDGCGNFNFIRCAHCEKRLCFEHFVIMYHHCL